MFKLIECNNEDFLSVKVSCPFCRAKNIVVVRQEQFRNWQNGTLIQNAFPNLNADQRELLKTGICKTCWDTM